MKLNELDAEFVIYHDKAYRVWTIQVGGEDVDIGEIELEQEIIGWDCEPVDEEGFNIDERIGYYADPTDEVEDVIRSYND